MNDSLQEKRFLQALGLCVKAGKLISGTDIICTEMRKKADSVKLVIEASDTSANTHKKLTDKCKYYSVRHIRTQSTSLAIGYAIGKQRNVAAVAITDKSLCDAVLLKLEANK